MYKKLFRKMCEKAVEKQFLHANGGEPLVEYADGIEALVMEVSGLMEDTIVFTVRIDMATTDEVEVWGYADENGAFVTHYTFNGDIVNV